MVRIDGFLVHQKTSMPAVHHLYNKVKDGPMKIYQQLVHHKKIKESFHQKEAIELLQKLHDDLGGYEPPIPKQTISLTSESKLESPDFSWVDKEKSFFSFSHLFSSKTLGWDKLFQSKSRNIIRGPKGIYLYGGVGTGKSMMMDLFFNSMTIQRKRRVHFHQFMQDVHQKIFSLKQKGMTHDPIPAIAAHLSASAWLLCFDELQVTNIVDAMLLRRLFGELMNNGVVMVTTSNRHPDDLYQNGIQRQSFLPTIALLKERCVIYNLDGGLDYRKQEQGKIQVYYRNHTNKNLAEESLKNALSILSKGHPIVPKTLSIWGRELIIPETCGRIAKTTFKQLCGEPRSSAEYLEIARQFDVLIISDIPQLSLATRNEARRFITLIDAIYDNKVKLIASFETSLQDLFNGDEKTIKTDRILVDDLKLNENELKSPIFTGDEEIFAFKRAVSRLVEMQGIKYWPDYPKLTAEARKSSFSGRSSFNKASSQGSYPNQPEQVKITQIPLDAGTGGRTMLDSESEGDVPVSWGAITNTSVLISVCDDEEPEEPSQNNRSSNNNSVINTTLLGSQITATTSKAKRSPNRDDSDSEDEDENGNKLERKMKDVIVENIFDPSTDPQFLACGFKIGFAEDRNKRFRRTMEDAHTIITDFGEVVGSGFFAVFDGHAGRAAADYCGESLHKIFNKLMSEKPSANPALLLNEAFTQVDKELASKKGLHSGCTAIVAYIRSEIRSGESKRVLYTANVGDARAILSRKNIASRLSYDHKGSDPVESRRIIETGGFMMNHRVNGVLAVTRSLGDVSMKEWVIGAPYTTETVLTEFDTTLIIACDGIWDVCPDQDAVNLIKEIKDPQECADYLVDYALDNRSTDNLTAIVVKINPFFK